MVVTLDLTSLIEFYDQMVVYLPAMIYSFIAGGLIGFERELKKKEAGLKTFILICCSSALFTILSVELGSTDPARIAAAILSSVSFLGLGVIWKDRNKIEGLTTAAYIWATTGLGMLIGIKQGGVALGLTIGMLISMKTVSFIESFIHKEKK